MNHSARLEELDAPAPPSKLRLALILGTLAGLGPLSIDMYLPSFPTIAESLGTDVASVQLTLATYLAGLAIGQLVYGPLTDRVGRRLPLLGGLALYALASVVCAYASSLPLLAASRFLQALGGSAGMVVSRAVVRDHLDERESARMYSSLMLVMGIAPILAPLLGARVLEFAGWRAIFGVLAGASALLFVVILLLLPESHPAERRVRLSAKGVFKTAIEVLRTPVFVRTALVGGLSQAAMFAYITGSAFVFIELFGVAPDQFGLIFGAVAFGLIAASQVNRLVVVRLGVATVLRRAVFVAAAAAGVLCVAGWAGGLFPLFLTATFVVVGSYGLIAPNATALAMAPFSARAGIASAVLGTLQTVCAAIASIAVSTFADGTARSMVSVMLAAMVLAVVLVLGATRQRA